MFAWLSPSLHEAQRLPQVSSPKSPPTGPTPLPPALLLVCSKNASSFWRRSLGSFKVCFGPPGGLRKRFSEPLGANLARNAAAHCFRTLFLCIFDPPQTSKNLKKCCSVVPEVILGEIRPGLKNTKNVSNIAPKSSQKRTQRPEIKQLFAQKGPRAAPDDFFRSKSFVSMVQKLCLGTPRRPGAAQKPPGILHVAILEQFWLHFGASGASFSSFFVSALLRLRVVLCHVLRVPLAPHPWLLHAGCLLGGRFWGRSPLLDPATEHQARSAARLLPLA